MTEHAAGIFVFFFLAEYASIILMCILITIVLLGGYEILSLLEYFNIFIKHVFNLIFFLLNNIYVYIELITTLAKTINYYIFNIESNYNEYINIVNYYS
jgi:NADH:ubiquinone oxidoreductase subunit H